MHTYGEVSKMYFKILGAKVQKSMLKRVKY